ncbi:MAG TPA: hypothetical protein VK206_12210 [Anaerolineales bacterium]|nr:hypothetical protein [Anaerolineales bacterium]
MKLNWKWAIGITLILIVLFALPFLWRLFTPFSGYGMMGGYRYSMPMMYGFYMMPFGMLFMWLIPLGTLILIVLGIIWLIKQLATKP